jgi:two-component system cell cycle sensor histidine kinase/response regulator CckA
MKDFALRLSLAYALVGVVWITASDELLRVLLGDGERFAEAQTFKGWFFVLVTAVCLWLVASRLLARASVAEEQRHEMQRRLARLAEVAPAGIFTTDAAGQWTLSNQRWSEFSGLSPAASKGSGWMDALHLSQSETTIRLWEAAVGSGVPFEAECHLQSQSGRDKWVFVTAVPERGPGGKITGYIGTCTDLTAYREIILQLRESELRYRELFERARDPIFEIGPNARFISVNEYCEKLTGYRRADWIGREFHPLVHPEDLPKAAVGFARILAGEPVTGLELRLLKADGQSVALEISMFPRFAEGKIAGALGIGRDISERRHLEEQLRQAQKMEAIGLLAGGVAHDFNNLLTVIHGQASLALGKAHTPEAAMPLMEISRAAERAADLTRQLLLFSRKQVIELRGLDLNDVLSGTARMLRRLIGEDISLRVLTAPAPVGIEADAGMLEQVLMNLAVNSRDAMPGGGTLHMAVDIVEIGADSLSHDRTHPAGRYARLSVSDTGCGIAKENLTRIFEPFFTTKPPGRGTGLGLATVFGIVEQHRGWVDVQSTVGEGTTFHIYIPALDEMPISAVATQAAQTPRGGTEHILVVEDEPQVRSLIRAILEGEGYAVTEASTGQQAIEAWRNAGGSIALLLTDIVLPDGMNGRQLAAKLRAEDPALKVLFSSGYTADAVDPALLKEPGVSFLQKPYVPSTLLQTLRTRLDS